MSIKSLSKLFKLFFVSCCFIAFTLSCTKKIQENKVVLKLGQKSWTLKQVQDYFQMQLSGLALEKQDPEKLKKELLDEILLRSFVENWAIKNKIQTQKISLSEEEKTPFLGKKKKLKAFRDHKNYLALYNLLLEQFFKKIPNPPIKEQKKFYKKNKDRFVEPAQCYLKQILVEKEKMSQILYQRLKQGESFDKLSRFHSLKKNPEWVKKGSLEVFDKACLLKKNSLSPIFKSPYGYHIFLVGEKKLKRERSFRQVQRQIIKFLKENKAKKQFQIWLKQEISKTPLFIDKKLLDKIHIQYKNNKI